MFNFRFKAAHRASNFNHETKPPVFYNQNNGMQAAIRPSLMLATTKQRQNNDRFLHASSFFPPLFFNTRHAGGICLNVAR
jgi:hypothetical protein